MQIIDVNQINSNTFDMISKQWMLISATADGKTNAMTASWGGLGFLWGKNVAFVFIRPQRYTKELVDKAQTLSLSFFSSQYRDMLSYMGKACGRVEDKIKKAGLTVSIENDAPVFEQAEMTLVCKKLYAQNLEKECFIQKDSIEKWYPQNDFHTMYVVEIEKVMVK